MNAADAATAAVSALLGGGGILAWWRARKIAPAERDSLIVTGAETATVALDKALDRIEKDNERLRAENAKLQQMIDTLQTQIDDLRDQLVTALRGANDAQAKLLELRAQIDQHRSH